MKAMRIEWFKCVLVRYIILLGALPLLQRVSSGRVVVRGKITLLLVLLSQGSGDASFGSNLVPTPTSNSSSHPIRVFAESSLAFERHDYVDSLKLILLSLLP